MIDAAVQLAGVVTGSWTQTNPPTGSMYFGFDEINPNNPRIQVCFQNMNEVKTFVADNTYKVEDTVKISVYLRPINSQTSQIAEAKTTYNNILTEVDSLLNGAKFTTNLLNEVWLGNWREVNFGVGRSVKPTVFHSEQIIKTLYYLTDSTYSQSAFAFIWLS